MLLLTKEDVEQATARVDVMRELIEAIEAALVDAATDSRWRPPALYPFVGAGEMAVPLMGVLRSRGVLGGRVSTVGTPATVGPGGRGYKLLFDLATLKLVALIEDVGLHGSMVGAHVGVATRLLSRKDASIVAAIGSGNLAMSCLDAVTKIRSVAEVRVYSPNAEHRQQFASTVAERFGVRATAPDTAEEAVSGAHVVNCATNNYFRGGPPVFDVDWLSPGSHVNTIGRREAPEDSSRRASVFTPTVADYEAVVPAWDPIDMGAHGAAEREVGRVAAGLHPGRSHDDEITLYLGPSIPAEHLALAAWVYDLASAAGVGTRWG